MSSRQLPDRRVRRRILARAKRLGLDARALRRRIRRTYPGPTASAGEMSDAIDRIGTVIAWIEKELELSKTVR